MEYREYKDLPRRLVMAGDQNNSREKKIYAYGIMALVRSTFSWLMVRTRHSTAISYILHGAYQPVHFSDLLKGITKPELIALKGVILGGTYGSFIDFYKKIFNQSLPANNYAYHRIMDLKEEILEIDEIGLPEQTVYSFPKGRRNRVIRNGHAAEEEETIVTATREFYEETGINAPDNININTSVIYETRGLANRQYCLKCWITTFNTEVNLEETSPIDKIEIVERNWIRFDPYSHFKAISSQYLKGKTPDKEVLLDKEVLFLCQEAIKAGFI